MRTLPHCHGPEDAIGAKACQSRQDCARVFRRRRLCACSAISHVTSAKEQAHAKRLSEQLADLSVRAKNTEDAVAAAQGKRTTRSWCARTGACRCDDGGRKSESGDQVCRQLCRQNWNTAKAKIAADMSALKANVVHAKQDLDAKHAATAPTGWMGGGLRDRHHRRSSRQSWRRRCHRRRIEAGKPEQT
jgi:hypothetical protein